MSTPLFESDIKSLPLLGRGKVRDNYAVGDDKMLIVTTRPAVRLRRDPARPDSRARARC